MKDRLFACDAGQLLANSCDQLCELCELCETGKSTANLEKRYKTWGSVSNFSNFANFANFARDVVMLSVGREIGVTGLVLVEPDFDDGDGGTEVVALCLVTLPFSNAVILSKFIL